MKRFIFLAWILFFYVGCSVNDSESVTTIQKESLNKSVGALDCSKPEEYRFVIAEIPSRKKATDPTMPKDVNIVVGEEIVSKVELPIADSEAKNFSLSSVEKTKIGFEIKADWGGGLYHYEIQFNFSCKENRFYLYEVRNVNFSTTDPDSGNYWDKKETKVNKIEPRLPIEKFVMLEYLQ